MADHNVTLIYAPDGSFTAKPRTISVKPGQTIAFKLGAGSSGGKIRITFHDRHFFATGNPDFGQTGVFHDGDGEVRVVSALSSPTTYHCELLDAQGHVLARSSEGAGGDIEPSNKQ